MNLETEKLAGGVTLVHLIGRMDIAGAAAVDLRISTIAGAAQIVIINLTEVSFIASMGIRTLVLAAKTIAKKGGRVVCFGANDAVAHVMETDGVVSILPIQTDLEAALAAVVAWSVPTIHTNANVARLADHRIERGDRPTDRDPLSALRFTSPA